MGHSCQSNGNRHWQNARAFTLIELVTALALMGLLLTGLAILARTTMEEVMLLESAPEEEVYPRLVSFLCERIDDISAVVEWDSTGIQYLDQLGRPKNLKLTALFRAFSLQHNEKEQSNPIRISIEPAWKEVQPPLQAPNSDSRQTHVLTITIQGVDSVTDGIRIQRLVQLRER